MKADTPCAQGWTSADPGAGSFSPQLVAVLLLALMASGCLGPHVPVTEYGHPEVYAMWDEARQRCVLQILIYDEHKFSTGVGGGQFEVDKSWCGR